MTASKERIQNAINRCAVYLEENCWYKKNHLTNEMVLKAIADKGFSGTVKFDNVIGIASPDYSYITFECEGWTIFICEEMYAEKDGVKVYAQPI